MSWCPDLDVAGEQVLRTAKASMVDPGTAASMALHLAARSEKHQDLRNKRPIPTGPMMSRLGRLWLIGRSRDGGMLTLRIAALLTSIVVQVLTALMFWIALHELFICIVYLRHLFISTLK